MHVSCHSDIGGYELYWVVIFASVYFDTIMLTLPLLCLVLPCCVINVHVIYSFISTCPSFSHMVYFNVYMRPVVASGSWVQLK